MGIYLNPGNNGFKLISGSKYIDKTCDFAELFRGLYIAKDDSFETYLNKEVKVSGAGY